MLSEKSYLIGLYNQGGIHWILIVSLFADYLLVHMSYRLWT